MSIEKTAFLSAAIKSATLNGSFNPKDVGRKIGLNQFQSEAAARALANDGVLSLGFDSAAHFTPEYRKAQQKLNPNTPAKPARRARARAKA